MTLPHRPLTNLELTKAVNKLKIPNFRGIFMKDTLPSKIKKKESGIINLDVNQNEGTHWTAYVKNNKNVLFFDSIGNLKPAREICRYFNSEGSVKIKYNYERYQKPNTVYCGHFCLQFLYNNQII